MDKLFDQILYSEKTIVYGTLGRNGQLVQEHLLKNYPTFDVIVISKYYDLPEYDHIHVNPESINKCDILMYMEPSPHFTVTSHRNATRVVVFTSHLVIHDTSTPSLQLTHFLDSPDLNRRVLDLQEASVQGRILKSHIDFDEVKTIGVNNPLCNININKNGRTEPLEKKTYLVADLTNSVSPLNTMLYLWDVADYLKENVKMVHRWLISFREDTLADYKKFVQECIDASLCRQLGGLLNRVPYYKSGVVDRTKKTCQVKKFCNLKYVELEDDLETMRACFHYDLNPLVGSLYLIE